MKIIICDCKGWFNIERNFMEIHKIKFIHKKDTLTSSFLCEFKPDYVFFIHWNWKVKKEIYENYNCVVFHTAHLPYVRGGTPIQNLILNGYDSSPVCILKMV